MASDNETVAEIREDVSEYLTSIGPSEYPSETQFEEFADRYEAAYKREVEKLVMSFNKFERVSESLSLAKKQIEAEIADKSKIIRELNEVRELNRKCCDENERLNSEVAELREFSNDMRTWFRLFYSCGSDPKSKWWRSCASCRRKSCPIHKWRNALKGAKDDSTSR